MRRYNVVVAPRLERDVEGHLRRLRTLELEGEFTPGYPDKWYEMFEEALLGLRVFAGHPPAPERYSWGRAVQHILFADDHYRILFLVVKDEVWAMRVRHTSQKRLKRSGPGTAYPW